MNRNLVFRALGLVLLCESLAMVPPLLLAVCLKEQAVAAFLAAIVFTLLPGLALTAVPANPNQVSYREGFVIATLGWVVMDIFGSLPFFFAGVLANPADALFETMSGFTTTGAS
ncbi:MAG: TrkH family potassium uptake protein, partial [Desulfotomaculales bacterium]